MVQTRSPNRSRDARGSEEKADVSAVDFVFLGKPGPTRQVAKPNCTLCCMALGTGSLSLSLKFPIREMTIVKWWQVAVKTPDLVPPLVRALKEED